MATDRFAVRVSGCGQRRRRHRLILRTFPCYSSVPDVAGVAAISAARRGVRSSCASRLSTRHPALNPVRFAYSSLSVLSRRGVPALSHPNVPTRCCPVMRGATVRQRCELSLLKGERVASVDNPRACVSVVVLAYAQKWGNMNTAGPYVCCVRKSGFTVGK